MSIYAFCSGRGHYDQTAFCGDILIFAIAFFAYDFCYVGRIAFNRIMLIHRNAEVFEAFDKPVYGGLGLIHIDNDAPYVQALAFENVKQANNVGVVGDA